MNNRATIPVDPLFKADESGSLISYLVTKEEIVESIWAALKNQACCNPTTACRIVMLNEQDVVKAVEGLIKHE